MGVGLNVVQEIISAHGGHIMLKNHPQGGLGERPSPRWG